MLTGQTNFSSDFLAGQNIEILILKNFPIKPKKIASYAQKGIVKEHKYCRKKYHLNMFTICTSTGNGLRLHSTQHETAS